MSNAIERPGLRPMPSSVLDDEPSRAQRKSRIGNLPPVRLIRGAVDQAQGPALDPQRLPGAAAVTDAQMKEALDNIGSRLGAASGSNIKLPLDIGGMSLQELIALTTNVIVEVTNKSTNLSLQRIKENGQAYDAKFQKQVKDNLQKTDDLHKAHEKARKGNVFTKVMNWAVASVEVVSGAAKLAAGVISGNPALIAGGSVELAAGTCGIIRNILEETGHQALAEKFGSAQLGLEIVSMTIDVFSVAQVVKAGVTVAKVTAEAVVTTAARAGEIAAEVAEGAVEMAVMQGGRVGAQAAEAGAGMGREAVEMSARQAARVGVEVGEDGARSVSTAAIKDAAKRVSRETLRSCEAQLDKLIEKLGAKEVEKIIGESAAAVVKTMVKDGQELIAEKVGKELTKEISKRLARAAAKDLGRSPSAVASALTSGANKVHSGVLAYQMAGLNADISEIDSGMDLRQTFMAALTSDSKDTGSAASEALNRQASSLNDALRLSMENPQFQVGL